MVDEVDRKDFRAMQDLLPFVCAFFFYREYCVDPCADEVPPATSTLEGQRAHTPFYANVFEQRFSDTYGTSMTMTGATLDVIRPSLHSALMTPLHYRY